MLCNGGNFLKNSTGKNVSGLAIIGFVISARSAVAQTPSDMSTIYSGVIFSVASFVVLILVGVLYQRYNSRRKNDLADDSGIDLMGLKQKNLLTPEEMKMVSAAIARRVAEKDVQQKRTGAARLSSSTLLHDPEVVRLQELALAKRNATKADVEAKPGAAEQLVAGEQNLGQSESAHIAEPLFPGDPIPAEPDSEPTIDTAESLDDVELPPEVQQLADAGILSPEELENVKRRLKKRQSSEAE